MSTLWKQSLARMRNAMLAWGLLLGFWVALVATLYPNFAAEQEALEVLLQAYPQEILAFFGVSRLGDLASPHGFLHVEFFSLAPLLLGIHALLVGVNLILDDEAKGVLDLLMAYPISRTTFFAARVLAAFTAMAVILGLIYGGLVLGAQLGDIAFTLWEMARPLMALALQWWVLFALGLLLAQVLGSRGLAGTLAGAYLVLSFFLTGLTQIEPDLEAWARWTPLYYYPGARVMTEAFDTGAVLTLLLVGVVLVGAAWLHFLHHDIRVHGEATPLSWWSLWRAIWFGGEVWPSKSKEASRVSRPR